MATPQQDQAVGRLTSAGRFVGHDECTSWATEGVEPGLNSNRWRWHDHGTGCGRADVQTTLFRPFILGFFRG